MASGKEINWHEIATHISGRNNKDCRKRWIYTLNPSVRKGPWSEEEDTLLFKGIQLHGFRLVHYTQFNILGGVELAKYLNRWPLISQMIGTRQPDRKSQV